MSPRTLPGVTTNPLHHTAHPKSFLCILTAVCETDGLMRRKRDVTQGVGLRDDLLAAVCLSLPAPRIPRPITAPCHQGTSGCACRRSTTRRFPGLPCPLLADGTLFKLRSIQFKHTQVEFSATSVPDALQLRLLVWVQWQSRALFAGGGRHFWVGRSGKSELAQTPTSPSTQAIYTYIYL